MPARQHVVDQVAELVEQRDDVAVLHQPARHVADQRAHGKLPTLDATGEVELRGVLVLALARMQVEVDPAEPLRSVVTVDVDVEDRDVVVPAWRVDDLGVGEAEQPAGDVEQPGAHLGEVEVRPQLLGVDVDSSRAVRPRRSTSSPRGRWRWRRDRRSASG